MDDLIPNVGRYRGIEIHDFQPQERIRSVVKPAIDAVYEISDPTRLLEYVGNSANPPEARLFAVARCNAAWELAAENREARPRFDRDRLEAIAAGLASLTWMNPRLYATLLDTSDASLRRDPENAARLETARSNSRAGFGR